MASADANPNPPVPSGMRERIWDADTDGMHGWQGRYAGATTGGDAPTRSAPYGGMFVLWYAFPPDGGGPQWLPRSSATATSADAPAPV